MIFNFTKPSNSQSRSSTWKPLLTRFSCLQNRHRLHSSTHAASTEDFLRSYARTTGIYETYLESHRLKYCVVDISGDSAERRKWRHAYGGVESLVFVASLSDYDTYLGNRYKWSADNSRDDWQNNLQESLFLFECLLNSEAHLRSSKIILLLNKVDIFRKMIKKIPIRDSWPEFTGPEGDYDAGTRFFTDKFCGMQRRGDDREIYVYYSEATDTETMQPILQSIEALLLSQACF